MLLGLGTGLTLVLVLPASAEPCLLGEVVGDDVHPDVLVAVLEDVKKHLFT